MINSAHGLLDANYIINTAIYIIGSLASLNGYYRHDGIAKAQCDAGITLAYRGRRNFSPE